MATDKNLVLGIVLIVLGVLLLLGKIPYLVLLAAIALIVMGVLILVGRMAGGTLIGAVAVALGVLLLAADRVPVVREIVDAAWNILILVLGIALIVFGILKVAGRR